ncbi:hypothetical protein [Anaerobacillus alkalilacustris]|nr:hypothetical protein [Anaerobacillus alkalilacustris]
MRRVTAGAIVFRATSNRRSKVAEHIQEVIQEDIEVSNLTEVTKLVGAWS